MLVMTVIKFLRIILRDISCLVSAVGLNYTYVCSFEVDNFVIKPRITFTKLL